MSHDSVTRYHSGIKYNWCSGLILTIVVLLSSTPSYAVPASYQKIFADNNCTISKKAFDTIIHEVEQKSEGAISGLTDCLRLNRTLMFQASLIDASQFQYAADLLREDENFVYRLIKVNPEVLKFVSPTLRLNKNFMKRATYLKREALKYADPELLDNKIFMREMIIIDYKNYIFASNRLRKNIEFAKLALNDNGLYLEHAPKEIKDNKELVKIAVKSNISALQFASKRLQQDKELKKLAVRKSSIVSFTDLERFLQEHYLDSSDIKHIGPIIANRMEFFFKNIIIERNYITKWQKFFKHDKNHVEEQMRLISADSRNYAVLWKDDFIDYPGVIAKIEEFFLSHQIDQNTIDSFSTTYLTKVKSDPLTLVFNVYLLRDSSDIELGPDYANVNSLTAIVQKDEKKKRWKMTVIEVIFDSELKMDIAFKNGHKKYILWDLYTVDEEDKNPKVIFKTEERFREFFEVYEEQRGGKYQMIYRTNLNAAKEHLD